MTTGSGFGIGLDWLLSPAMSTLPVMIFLFLGAVVMFFAYMAKARVGLFKWWGAIEVPVVLNYEGGALIPATDRLRKTVDAGRTYFESKEFGDKFDGTGLMAYTKYVKGRFGRWKLQMLPVIRMNGEWTPMSYETDASGKAVVKQVFSSDARIALATMEKGNDDFLLSNDFWEKYGGFLTVALCIGGFIVSLVIITQWVGAVISTSTSGLTAATAALTQAINCTAAHAATPVPPPR